MNNSAEEIGCKSTAFRTSNDLECGFFFQAGHLCSSLLALIFSDLEPSTYMRHLARTCKEYDSVNHSVSEIYMLWRMVNQD